MYKQLDSRIKALKEKDSDYTLACQEFEEENNQPFILVIVTPLMKRVHKLVSALMTFGCNLDYDGRNLYF